MRDKLKGQDLSFTEIAKIVGERWQVLASHEKEPCERQAQKLKERYYVDLIEYKKTPQYAQYQEYLAEFKAKHNQQTGKHRCRNCSRSSLTTTQTTKNPSQNRMNLISGRMAVENQVHESNSLPLAPAIPTIRPVMTGAALSHQQAAKAQLMALQEIRRDLL